MTDPARGAPVFLLADAVADLPSVRGAGRAVLAGLLRADIAAAVRQDPRPRFYALNLVQACLDRQGGLRELLGALHAVEGDSLAMRRIRELAMALPDRDAGGDAGG